MVFGSSLCSTLTLLPRKSTYDTKAVIVLPNWPVYKAITQKLKLLRQIPKGENVFMRPTTTGIYDPHDFIKSIWVKKTIG